jgi:hypothetical protein
LFQHAAKTKNEVKKRTLMKKTSLEMNKFEHILYLPPFIAHGKTK